MTSQPRTEPWRASRYFACCFVAAFAMLAAVAAGQTESGDTGVEYVVTERDAYLLAPPRMIEGAVTQRPTPSPAGRYLLYRSIPSDFPPDMIAPEERPDTEVCLGLWDARTKKSVILWRAPLSARHTSAVDDVHWFPSGDKALAIVGSSRTDAKSQERKLLLIDALEGSARALASLDGISTLAFSPREPVAVVYSTDPASPSPKQTVRVISSRGTVGPTVTLPQGAFTTTLRWSADGRYIYFDYAEPAPPSLQPAEPPEEGVIRSMFLLSHLAFDVRTSRLEKIERLPKDTVGFEDPAPPALPICVVRGHGTLQLGSAGRTMRSLWLVDTRQDAQPPPALVAADGEDGLLLADASAVVYRQRGALFAVPLVRIDRQAFAAMRREAQKKLTLEKSKEIAIAVQQYAQDYDEEFPPADRIQEVLEPYLRNRAVFTDAAGAPAFAYVYKGDVNMAFVQEPAQTVMAYLYGPAGRAVIYMDGHMKWQEEKDYPRGTTPH